MKMKVGYTPDRCWPIPCWNPWWLFRVCGVKLTWLRWLYPSTYKFYVKLWCDPYGFVRHDPPIGFDRIFVSLYNRCKRKG